MDDHDNRKHSDITRLLNAATGGDAGARQSLWNAIYDELRRVAKGQVAGRSDSLQATALVHEAYFRLFGQGDGEWANRRQFYAAAARAMRQIRIDDVRHKSRLKRGAGVRPMEFKLEPAMEEQDPAELLAVHEALDKLEELASRKAEVVMLRYYVGLTVDECAEVLDTSPRTVDSDWRFARMWLHRELSGEAGT